MKIQMQILKNMEIYGFHGVMKKNCKIVMFKYMISLFLYPIQFFLQYILFIILNIETMKIDRNN